MAEAPITDFNVECHLAIDRFKEAARLEKEATWAAARAHCAKVDDATLTAITAIRSVAGMPSLHLLANEDEVKTSVVLSALGRLGRLARNQEQAA